jgi:4'-phosphopantetheinyl transferase
LENRPSLHYAPLPTQPWEPWLDAWLPRLPAAKRDAIARLRDGADRIASVLGIALLAAALRARGIALAPALLEYPRRGKPRLRGAPDFSIAHAGGLVACALGRRGRVGLDLEPRGAVRPGQLRLVLDRGERAAVASGALAAVDAWVMKEAVLKAAGRGVDAARRVVLRDRGALLDGIPYSLLRADLPCTHAAWVALGTESPRAHRATDAAMDAVAVPALQLCAHDACDALALPACA